MTDTQVLEIAQNAMIMASKLAMPLLLTALLIGVFVSLIQTVTQIQEMTLSFVPKVVAIGLVLIFAGNWMLRELVVYSQNLWGSIPSFAG